MKLGEEVKRRRTDTQLSQEALAGSAEVTVQLIRRLEAGRANPTLGTLHAIAVALGVSIAELL